MRIVKFDLVEKDGVIVYPEEGISSFGQTLAQNGSVIGEYYGVASEEDLPTYIGIWPIVETQYKTSLNNGEILQLLGATAYASLYAKAYAANPADVDPQALFFLESAKNPYSEDKLIIVNQSPVTDAMEYFVAVGYITRADADRVMAGKPLN